MSINDLKHYYVDDHTELKNRKEITFRFLTINCTFDTADAIFSKDRVDQGSILLLESFIENDQGKKVLDYGCGYGVIGVVLSKLGCDVVAIDVTKRAVELSKINAKKNDVAVAVELIKDNNVKKYNNCFNSVLLNPPIRAGKVVIYEMFENAYDFLKDKGELFIVIRKQHGAKSAVKKLESLFSDVTVINKSAGYWIIKGVKHLTT